MTHFRKIELMFIRTYFLGIPEGVAGGLGEETDGAGRVRGALSSSQP